MRLLERTLKMLYIAPGLAVADGLGAARRAFSAERVPVRASLIPAEGALERLEPGLLADARCLALMPVDAPIAAGDGVCETAEGEPEWLCVEVRGWSAHLAASLVRRPAA